MTGLSIGLVLTALLVPLAVVVAALRNVVLKLNLVLVRESGKGRRRKGRFLGAMLAIWSLGGCATLGLADEPMVSVEEEWEIGRQLEEELAEELPLVEDPEDVEPVERIGEAILAETEKADLDWRFHVVEDETVNAFNVPGGLVYVHTGLLEEVGDEDELAAVMGHELGHGVARHGAERMSQQYELGLLAQVVLGEEPGLVQEMVAQIAAAGALARFSREQEFEADELGVAYTHAAGYDPAGMVRFFERLLELQEREPGSVERFFATHPDLDDRIEEVRRQIAELGAGISFGPPAFRGETDGHVDAGRGSADTKRGGGP